MKASLLIIFLFVLAMPALPQEGDATMQVLAPGERFDLGGGMYGTWEFTQKPQIGMVILKIRLFDKNGAQISPLTIIGRSGMPSMPGHHDSGDIPFKLNKKQNYLLPVNVVMPGDWEVQLIFSKGEEIVLHAAIRFDV